MRARHSLRPGARFGVDAGEGGVGERLGGLGDGVFALETFEAGAVFPGDVGAGPGFTFDGAQEQQAGRHVLRGAQAEVEEEIENAALGVKKWAGVRSEGGTGDGQGLFEAGDVGGQQGGRRRG